MDDMAMVAHAEAVPTYDQQMFGLGAGLGASQKPVDLVPVKNKGWEALALMGGTTVIAAGIGAGVGYAFKGKTGAVVGGLLGPAAWWYWIFRDMGKGWSFISGLSQDTMAVSQDPVAVAKSKKQLRAMSLAERRQKSQARRATYWQAYAQKHPTWKAPTVAADLPAMVEGACPEPYELFTTRPLFGDPETVCVKKCRTGTFDNGDGTYTQVYRTRMGACVKHLMYHTGDGGGGNGGGE